MRLPVPLSANALWAYACYVMCPPRPRGTEPDVLIRRLLFGSAYGLVESGCMSFLSFKTLVFSNLSLSLSLLLSLWIFKDIKIYGTGNTTFEERKKRVRTKSPKNTPASAPGPYTSANLSKVWTDLTGGDNGTCYS